MKKDNLILVAQFSTSLSTPIMICCCLAVYLDEKSLISTGGFAGLVVFGIFCGFYSAIRLLYIFSTKEDKEE